MHNKKDTFPQLVEDIYNDNRFRPATSKIKVNSVILFEAIKYCTRLLKIIADDKNEILINKTYILLSWRRWDRTTY